MRDDKLRLSRNCIQNYNRQYPESDEEDILEDFEDSTQLSKKQARFLLGPKVNQSQDPTTLFHLHPECTGLFVSAENSRNKKQRVLVTFLRIFEEKKRRAAFHNFLGKAPPQKSPFPRGRRQVRVLSNLGYSHDELREWAGDPSRQIKPEGEPYNRILPIPLRPHMAFRARRGEEFLVFLGAEEIYIVPRDRCAKPATQDPFYSDVRYFPAEGGLLSWRRELIRGFGEEELRPDQVRLTRDFCSALQGYGPLKLESSTKAQVTDYVAYNLLRHPPQGPRKMEGGQYYGLLEVYFGGDSFHFPAYFAMRKGKWVVSVDPFQESVPYAPTPEEAMFRDYLLKKGWTVEPPDSRQEVPRSGKGS